VTCFGYEGIDAVKNALRCAEAKNTPDNQVKVKLVSPPLYGTVWPNSIWTHLLTIAVLTSQCLDKTVGIACLEQAITDIKESITKAGGDCQVKMAPKAVTENDDAELAALMEKRERENQEVSGDEDESTSDEGGVVEADS
jgi:translation initiation factor 2 subunit 1